MERPELDISALVYDDEATVKRKQREYEQGMESYLKEKILSDEKKYIFQQAFESQLERTLFSKNEYTPIYGSKTVSNKMSSFKKIAIVVISIFIIIAVFEMGYDRGYTNGHRDGHNEAYDNDDIITDNQRSKSNTAETESWQKGLSVYITNSGIKYHRSWCTSLSNSKIGVTLAKAISKSYEPCEVCKPPPEMP